MFLLGQCCGCEICQVVKINERFPHTTCWKDQPASLYRPEQKMFAEVLGEPRRPHDRPVEAGLLDRTLAGAGALFAAARQQHKPAHPMGPRSISELCHEVRDAGESKVGGVADVCRAHAAEGGVPSRGLSPVERMRGSPGGYPCGHAA